MKVSMFTLIRIVAIDENGYVEVGSLPMFRGTDDVKLIFPTKLFMEPKAP